MEENWIHVKKRSGGSKNSPESKDNFSQGSQPNVRYGQHHSDLNTSGGINNNKFKPPSLANKNTPFSNNTSPKRGGYRGGGGYRPKRQPVIIPDFKDPEEEEKFTELKKQIPHIKMPGEIRRLATSIRIDGLADKMLSEEWIEFQRFGWEFNKVITPNEEVDIPEDDGYELLPIENKWGDFVLFKKIS